VERFAPVGWSDSHHPLRGASPRPRKKYCRFTREKHRFLPFPSPAYSVWHERCNSFLTAKGSEQPPRPFLDHERKPSAAWSFFAHEPHWFIQRESRLNTLCTDSDPSAGLRAWSGIRPCKEVRRYRSSLMNFRGKAGSASALADSWHLTHADILCCAVPIVVFLSIISVV
jgi:hypothetical protein